jgi:MarR family transcriptional regulator, organic hydroperoxide resistance regulator
MASPKRTDGELLLSNQLCFLVHRLDRAIAAKYRPLLGELGLTYPQYLAMMALWEHGELGIGELCELLDLDTGTVSPLVKRLEAAGFAEKARREDDERAVTVRITKKGRGLEEKARGIPGALASCLLSGSGEYRDLKDTFNRLIERLEASH